MASQNKKNKAKNSYIHNGGEKNDLEQWKCKGTCYFTKRDRRIQNDRLRFAAAEHEPVESEEE